MTDQHDTIDWDQRLVAPQPVREGCLRRIELFCRRRGLAILATTAFVLLVTAISLHLAVPHYTAHASVLIDSRREKPFGPDNALHLISLENADVESAVALIRGGSLLHRVVAAEGLLKDPEFVAHNDASGSLWSWSSFLRTKAEALSPEAVAAAALWRKLRVERVGKSFVLALSVTSLEPAKAARLTNAVAEAFVADQREALLDASQHSAAFFADRLGPLGENLRRSEDRLARFRHDHALFARTVSAAGDTAATISEQQLGELNSRLASAQAETAQAQARFDQAKSAGSTNRGLETVPDVVHSSVVGELRKQQAEVSRKEADLAARYTDAYPLLVNARAERREVEKAIAREVARIVDNLRDALDVAKSGEASLRTRIETATGAAGLDNDLGPQLRTLERQKLVDQTLFEAYLAKARAAEQQAAFEGRDIRIISPAETPTVPAFPQRWLVAACMGVFGLTLGVGLSLGLDARAPGFASPQHTESELGLPVIAAVPWLPSRERVVEGRLLDPPRYLASRPNSRYAEAVHAIRAGIRMSAGPPPKVVLVTSSSVAEGKSVIALSLALTAARAGQRVLLVDADLRSPSLSRGFGYDHRLGLVDMLAGLVGTDETTLPLGGGLAFMPSGRGSAVAPELFASPRMALYLEHLRSTYDFVVIDAAPAGAVVDARVLTALSDRFVFVVGWRHTARETVARNLRALRSPHKLAGVVLNKIDERRLPYGAGWARAMSLMARRAQAEHA